MSDNPKMEKVISFNGNLFKCGDIVTVRGSVRYVRDYSYTGRIIGMKNA